MRPVQIGDFLCQSGRNAEIYVEILTRNCIFGEKADFACLYLPQSSSDRGNELIHPLAMMSWARSESPPNDNNSTWGGFLLDSSSLAHGQKVPPFVIIRPGICAHRGHRFLITCNQRCHESNGS